MGKFSQLSNVAETTRPIASTSMFLGVSVVYWASGMSAVVSLFSALPVLFICAAGFAINDIFDQESDRINHPERPLANYPALNKSVGAAYVIVFLISIALISAQPEPLVRFAWAMLLLTLSNYAFVKRNVPALKNLYMVLVAGCGLSAVDISVNASLSGTLPYLIFGTTVFARELAMDVPDIIGDGNTLAKIIGPHTSKVVSIICYFSAFGVMALVAESQKTLLFAAAGYVGLSAYVICLQVWKVSEKQLRPLTGLIVAAPIALIVS